MSKAGLVDNKIKRQILEGLKTFVIEDIRFREHGDIKEGAQISC